MRVVLRPLPVLYACQGCEEFGQKARDIGALFDRAGAVEMVWLGSGRGPGPISRFPIFSLDGCTRACARRWLRDRGIAEEHSFVIGGAK